MKSHLPKARRDAFTLIELITVVTIIALLFSLVVGGFTFADRFSKRSKTEVTKKAISSGLENYSNEFGGYPEPVSSGATTAIAKKVYIVGGATCLYQAMSGDGANMIGVRGSKGILKPLGTTPSDGNLDDSEAKNVMLKDMPKELWAKTDSFYYIIDGFGHPFRYIKSAPTQGATPSLPPPAATTINRGTYDIWSYAEDEKNLTANSLQSLTGSVQTASRKWIKNW